MIGEGSRGKFRQDYTRLPDWRKFFPLATQGFAWTRYN